jgi:hypothetical protein
MKKAVLFCLLLMGFNLFSQENKLYTVKQEEFLKLDEKDATKGFVVIDDYTLDKKGNIVITELKRCDVVKFANDGTFLKIIGRKGNGPGEFIPGFTAAVSPAGKTCVIADDMGGKTIQLFDKNDKFVKRFDYAKLQFTILNFVFVDNENIAAYCQDISKGTDGKGSIHEYISIININSLKVTPISEKLKQEDPFGNRMYTDPCADNSGKVYFALTGKKEYKAYQYDVKSGKLKVITKKFKPVMIRGKKLEEFNGMIEYRKRVSKKIPLNTKTDEEPYFNTIACQTTDGKDNLWVFTSEKLNEEIMSVDLFDKNGIYKKTFYLANELLGNAPWSGYKIYNNYIYSRAKNKQGEICLNRFKLPDEIWK